jgi:hypothetical protein
MFIDFLNFGRPGVDGRIILKWIFERFFEDKGRTIHSVTSRSGITGNNSRKTHETKCGEIKNAFQN